MKLRLFTYFVLIIICMLISMPTQPNFAGTAAVSGKRRANIPHFSSEVTWAEAAIFWFGENESHTHIPGRNYTDVRTAYTNDGLHIRFTVIDYYLWSNNDPQPADDLTLYDAAAIYLDTNGNGGTAPQTDDYTFLVGARHYPTDNAPEYHRQARGTGAGWDTNWEETWTDQESMQWSNCGPNDNGCNIDYGWTAIFNIPWAALGLSGPPAEGTVWGFAVQLHDRDDNPPAGYVSPEHWPETFNENSPATWGELHFGEANYQPPTGTATGTTVIRASSQEDNTVEDAWMGGGGVCGSGHEGDGVNYGSEVNHGGNPPATNGDLFVGTETAPTHFPCFNKSFFRFSLDDVPAGKVILSATFNLHHWGNANPQLAQPSWVHLFSITDPWEEMEIHWNNAPLAQENIDVIQIAPLQQNPGWPGVPHDWDATQAVAEAYGNGQPVSLAIYSSDSSQHSSKYLTSSETGDWNEDGRPQLTIVWGEAQAALEKQVFPWYASNGDTLYYTLSWASNGQALTMTDTLPDGLSAPNALTANFGAVSYESVTRQIVWTGTIPAGETVIVSYQNTVLVNGPLTLSNTAVLADGGGTISTDTAIIWLDPYQIFLPIALR